MPTIVIKDINENKEIKKSKIIYLKVHKGYDVENKPLRNIFLPSVSVINNSLIEILLKSKRVIFLYVKKGMIIETKKGSIIKSFYPIRTIDDSNYKIQIQELYISIVTNSRENNYKNIVSESKNKINLMSKNYSIPNDESWKIFIYILKINKRYDI